MLILGCIFRTSTSLKKKLKMWSVWTPRCNQISDYISPSTVLTSLPCKLSLVFHDLLLATSEPVALDTSFIEGKISEKPAVYKWWYLSFSKINCSSRSPISCFYFEQVNLEDSSFGYNHFNPVAYLHLCDWQQKYYFYNLLKSDYSPVLDDSLCIFTVLGLWIVTNFSHSSFWCFLAL